MAMRVATLRSAALFAELQDTQLEVIAQCLRAELHRTGDDILGQGGKSGVLFLLISGRASVYRKVGDGREVILADLRDGDHFGEMSLVDGLPHSASVRATQDCVVARLPAAALAQALASDSSLSLAVLQGLSKRLRLANTNIGFLALVEVRGRIAQKLLGLAEVVDGRHVIRERLSRSDLGKRVGASREMVSRVLAEMEKQGLFETDEHGHLVLNTSA